MGCAAVRNDTANGPTTVHPVAVEGNTLFYHCAFIPLSVMACCGSFGHSLSALQFAAFHRHLAVRRMESSCIPWQLLPPSMKHRAMVRGGWLHVAWRDWTTNHERYQTGGLPLWLIWTHVRTTHCVAYHGACLLAFAVWF